MLPRLIAELQMIDEASDEYTGFPVLTAEQHQ